MKKIIFILGLLLIFYSCVENSKKVDYLQNFNIRGFQFGATKEKIIKNEQGILIDEGNIFSTETLSYKVDFLGFDSKIQYLFPDNELKSAWYNFHFEKFDFKDSIKNINILEKELAKIYGEPHFIGFKDSLYPDSKILNKKITDKNIKTELENEKCIYIVEWYFKDQVEIQLVIRGQKKSGLVYYLNYTAPDYALR